VNGPRKDCKTMITYASYNRKQQTLHITVNKESYWYYNVPLFIYNDLAKSSSKEDFFEAKIKNVFSAEKQNNV